MTPTPCATLAEFLAVEADYYGHLRDVARVVDRIEREENDR